MAECAGCHWVLHTCEPVETQRNIHRVSAEPTQYRTNLSCYAKTKWMKLGEWNYGQ